MELQIAFHKRKFNGCVLSVPCSVSLCAWKQGVSLFSGCVPIGDTCLSENTLVLLQTGHLQKLSAERVKSNKRLTVCLHTSESTHLQAYCLTTLFPFSQDLLVSQKNSVTPSSQCYMKSAVFLKKKNYCNLLRKVHISFFLKD